MENCGNNGTERTVWNRQPKADDDDDDVDVDVDMNVHVDDGNVDDNDDARRAAAASVGDSVSDGVLVGLWGGLRHLAHNGHIKGRSLRLPGAAISLLNVYIAGHDIGAATVVGGYKGKPRSYSHTSQYP